MKVADTNVVVRFIVEDDDEQTRIATGVIATDGILVSNTVLLESEWVWRSIYRFEHAEISEALQSLQRTRGVTFAQPEIVARAVGWHADGMDFADALHLAQVGTGQRFATFDRKLAIIAARNPPSVAIDLL